MSDREPVFTAIRATYRLQFHKGFTFRDATALVPYLARLGISHIYASPLMEARPGSTHGYDIVNHNRLNPEIGTEAEFSALVAALKAEGMGLILDIVPNHMAVGGADNAWWLDVLEWGEASPYAAYFDINWDPLREDLKGRVLLPVLGDQYGAVLERGEIVLRFEPSEGSFSAWYYNHRFPISPFNYAAILEQGGPVLARFASDFAGLRRLSLGDARARAAEVRQRLTAATAEPGVVPAIAAALLAFAGRPGRPASFRRLHRLLEAQAYRLANWRVAAEEINYRRFFNINDLAGLRIELPELFAATHRMVFAMIERGDIQGLRIDHIDGLFDPAGYCAALREEAGEALYITVEKILARYERLPEWPIEGSTGYDFANQALALFVDPEGEAAMTRLYQRLTGRGEDFDAVLYAAKKRIMQVNLASEMNVLARRFHRLAIGDWRTRDFTFNGMLSALEEVAAAFPVYRTYVGPQGAGADDRHYIDWAIGLAKARWRPSDTTILDFIQDVLLADLPGHSRPNDALRTAMQFQQVTGPVMAKAFEDTAFYRYFRLLALNEVGGDPRRFGMSCGAFHHLTADRARSWPRAMLTTATHDTKRGEDARLRIALLSEMPREWGRRVTHWLRLNRRHRAERGGAPVPDRNIEYLFYQMLVGAWPVGLDPADMAAVAELTERIEAAMIKSVREGKEQSSWSYPNMDYEAGLTRFVRGVLDPARPNPFLADFADFIGMLARPAAIASLAQLVLKLTVPGVPDIYQGGELWDFSLVDPDNRRPVDFAQRQRLLDEVSGFGADSGPHPYPPPLAGEGVTGAVSYGAAATEGVGEAASYNPPPQAGEGCVGAFAELDRAPAALVHELTAQRQDGREKLFVTARLLGLRRDHPELFAAGDYQPLGIGEGRNSDRLCAFARSYRDEVLIVVVPHLTYGLFRDGGPADFGITDIALPSPGPWRNVFTGEMLASRDRIRATELFEDFPIAVLLSENS
jgi:(1->4)-alpha-D-glucan 1-alpha-D-glucosylmutase